MSAALKEVRARFASSREATDSLVRKQIMVGGTAWLAPGSLHVFKPL